MSNNSARLLVLAYGTQLQKFALLRYSLMFLNICIHTFVSIFICIRMSITNCIQDLIVHTYIHMHIHDN